MKSSFKFDKKTGTMVMENSPEIQEIKKEEKPIDAAQVQQTRFDEEKKMNIKSDIANVVQNHVLQMKRMDKPTPVQLLDENGNLEAYIDSVNAGVMMFREREDYDVYQIVDERTNKPLAYIGGYALQISFNMAELKSMERVEQCLQGLNKLFRKFITDQALNR